MPTIALVNDDRNILTSVGRWLETKGYSVQKYNDGAAALQGLQDNPPDMAIFDIKMPRMDGMELLRRAAAEVRPAGDLPDLQGRGDRRAVRPQDGRRRLHPQAVLAAPAGRAREGRAAPRRTRSSRPPRQEADAKVVERGQLAMDPERHTCTWNGEPVTLTVTEFLILQALATAPRHGQEPRRS
jgi:two-component system response regulator ChvI